MFPALFPVDELVGRNHFADADALMCRKVVIYYPEALSLEPNLPKIGNFQATSRETWNRVSGAQSRAKPNRNVLNDDEEEQCTKKVRNAVKLSHTASRVATRSQCMQAGKISLSRLSRVIREAGIKGWWGLAKM